MINIATTKEVKGYSKPYVLLQVTHAMPSADLTKLVECAVETGHMQAIINGLPKDIQILIRRESAIRTRSYKQYMVSADHGKAPQYIHTSEDEAHTEACRLAHLHPGTYRVLQVLEVISSRSTVVHKVQETEVIEIADSYKL